MSLPGPILPPSSGSGGGGSTVIQEIVTESLQSSVSFSNINLATPVRLIIQGLKTSAASNIQILPTSSAALVNLNCNSRVGSLSTTGSFTMIYSNFDSNPVMNLTSGTVGTRFVSDQIISFNGENSVNGLFSIRGRTSGTTTHYENYNIFGFNGAPNNINIQVRVDAGNFGVGTKFVLVRLFQ
jgi:hypothetical protein